MSLRISKSLAAGIARGLRRFLASEMNQDVTYQQALVYTATILGYRSQEAMAEAYAPDQAPPAPTKAPAPAEPASRPAAVSPLSEAAKAFHAAKVDTTALDLAETAAEINPIWDYRGAISTGRDDGMDAMFLVEERIAEALNGDAVAIAAIRANTLFWEDEIRTDEASRAAYALVSEALDLGAQYWDQAKEEVYARNRAKRLPLTAEEIQNRVNRRSISDDDICASCANCYYCPGEMSLCAYALKGGDVWPGKADEDGYIDACSKFAHITVNDENIVS